MKTDKWTTPASEIGRSPDAPALPNVAVYKLASRFLSCRAAKFVECKLMKSFGVQATGASNLAKVAEHVAKHGESGSPKARQVLAVLGQYTIDQLLALTPAQIAAQLPQTYFDRLVGVAIVGAGWAEHYGYALVPQSVAMRHYDATHNAAPAREVLTPEQLKDASIYGLTNPDELVWFRSCRDHGVDFDDDGRLYNF